MSGSPLTRMVTSYRLEWGGGAGCGSGVDGVLVDDLEFVVVNMGFVDQPDVFGGSVFAA